MKHIATDRFEAEMQVAPPTARPGAARRVLAALGRFFRPPADPDRLSPQLRRDAGIDAQTVEQVRAARAPLIR